MPDSEPRYDARTVEAPDGTRITVAYKPGSRIEHMTDAEFLAEVHPALLATKPCPAKEEDVGTGMPPGVVNLAAERLKRHQPGTPFTAEELTPFLTGPAASELAETIAKAMNRGLFGDPRDWS